MKTATDIREYLARIGRKGGCKSRPILSAADASEKVRVREARRAFKKFHAQCFWHMRQDMLVTREDIPEIIRGLRKNGGRHGFLVAAKLCR